MHTDDLGLTRPRRPWPPVLGCEFLESESIPSGLVPSFRLRRLS